MAYDKSLCDVLQIEKYTDRPVSMTISHELCKGLLAK